jgi:hypothetical protein
MANARFFRISLCAALTIASFSALPAFAADQAAAKTPQPGYSEKELLKKAKAIVVACQLFALDYRGRFPTKLTELCPDYLPDRSAFVCALSPDEPIGYDYFAGRSDLQRQITLQSKAPTPDGEWIVVYNNGDVELMTKKQKVPE